MEKRLFLAVFLSLAVVFGFQALFGPKPRPGDGFSQAIENKEIRSDYSKPSIAVEPSTKVNAASSFLEEVVSLQDGGLRAEFSNKGGSLKIIELLDLKYTIPAKDYLKIASLEDKQFHVVSVGAEQIVYEYTNSKWRVQKQYCINSRRTLTCSINFKNVSAETQKLEEKFSSFIIDLSRMDKSELASDWTLFEYSIATGNKIIRKGSVNRLDDKWNREEPWPVDWFGFRNRYFATIVKPKLSINSFEIKSLSATELAMGSALSSPELSSGEAVDFEFMIYAGPQLQDALKAATPGFERIMAFSDWAWLDAISKAIYWLLGAIHKIVPVWGICIILISLIVYGLMYPLTLKSLTSMKKMQVLQPKIKELQEKHKKNPEKMNQEVMELYKKHGVNPLGGCLPMLLQMPIFVGLYQVLWRSVYFRGEKFLWIQDLSMPDRLIKLPGSVPFVGDYFNILPILMMGIMFVQQKLSSKSMVITDPQQAAQQKMMTTLFPVMIGFIFYNFASGLNLYFVVFYLLSAATQWKISQEKAQV